MELQIQDAVMVEDPPFENSTPVEAQFAENVHITRANGGFVVSVDPYPREGKTETYVVTTKAKLVKLLKRIIEE